MPTLPKMCLNGAIVAYEDCKVHAFSGGLKYGGGVFEGLRAYWNADHGELYLFRLTEHLERLRFGMRVLRFDTVFGVDHMADCILRMIRANEVRQNIHIRIIAFIESDDELTGCGPIGLVCGAVPRGASKFADAGMNVVVSSYARLSDNTLPPRVKGTANYINNRAAELEAKRHGYDGVLMLTQAGKLSEGSGACFFMVRDGVLYTPDVTSDILESITRRTVIEIARRDLKLEVVERTLDRTEVYAADEAFWCGTGYEVIPIVSCDRLAIGDGKPGAVTRQVQQRYFDVVYGRTADYAAWRLPIWSRQRAAARITNRETAMTSRISRRQLGGLALGAGAAASLAGGAAAQTPRRGGNAVLAAEAQPPTMDMHFSTTIATRNIAMHMYEQLVTRGENNEVIPELAESIAESQDGLTYTIKLRQGIKFHNGKTMTSADVLATYQRYQRIGLSRSVLSPVANMAAPDPATFVVTLRERVPVFLDELSQFGVPISIHPAEEMSKEGNRIEPIGTGPYQFVEWVPDSHVKLRRYDGYTPDTRYPGTNGFGGNKTALLDTIEFRPVAEPGARVAGLETGQFQVVEDIPPRAAERLRSNNAIVIHLYRSFWQQDSWVNHARAPTDKLLVRRAIQTALDMEEIMTVAADGVFDLQPGFQYPGNPYYVTEGREFYNVNNPARAREMLREAGYNNEQLVLLTNSTFQSMRNAGISVTEQLRAIGLNVRMDVFDWPTAIANQRNREAWNLWFTGQGTGPAVGPFSAYVNLVSPQNQSFVPDPELDRYYNEMRTLPTEAARIAAFGRFQRRAYENVHLIKFGDLTKVQAARANVKGFRPYRIPRFWNVWLES